jgi:N-acetylmuramoyl-L-alanine amidase
MNHRTTTLVLLTAVLLSVVSAQAGDKIRVSIAGGYDEISSFTDREVVYVSLSDLANSLGGTLSWTVVGHEVSYKDQSFRFDFLLGSPFYKYQDTIYNMTYPAVLRDGQMYVPAETFLPTLDQAVPQSVVWQQDDRAISVESDYFNVTDLSVQPKANGLLIEIQLSTTLAYEVFVTEGNWINVSIRGAKINRSRILSREDPRLMYELRVHQMEGNTGQISIRLKQNIDKWYHKLETNPTRIQIAVADVNFEMDTTTLRPEVDLDAKIDAIVIDAGHGGDFYGAIGPKGTREKDVTLEIAKRLARLVRKDKQFKVVMTRDQDKTVSLEERARIANNAAADLFISIHANASPKRTHSGWNVYFLAPALNDSARAVEQLENGYYLRESADAATESGSDTINPVLSILNEMIMTEFQSESNDFAMMVDREFRKRLSTKARGVDQAGFFVLNKVFAPSVLIESAFISNTAEEKLLKSKDYQDKVALSLYEAIKRFKAKVESRK